MHNKRRILDRFVGYKISPLLWKVKGLSAGRVQSVALRLIVERKKKLKFYPQEYWSLDAVLKGKEGIFTALLGKRKKHIPATQAETEETLKAIKEQDFIVAEVNKRERKRKPAPPFTTSSLQQEASRKLGFTTRKTMMIAQQLYEGLNIGKEGVVGLITYIRTDATRISTAAQAEARAYIESAYGKTYVRRTACLYS